MLTIYVYIAYICVYIVYIYCIYIYTRIYSNMCPNIYISVSIYVSKLSYLSYASGEP